MNKTEIIIKLTMLIGACRMKNITKKQIEKSLEEFRDKVNREMQEPAPKQESGE